MKKYCIYKEKRGVKRDVKVYKIKMTEERKNGMCVG